MTQPLGEHVTHILLAEFDIDKGSSLAHQYPEPTGTDEHLLAELMLPDGAHLRTEDWTVFFLNQTVPDPDKISIDLIPDRSLDNETPLLYALNLVRTRHDKEARRGAVVKAMAICTRHQFLHIYKPVLLLALDNYFQDPSIECLASLYQAVNSMDCKFMPIFNAHEKAILRASENKDMFEEKFTAYENSRKHMQEGSAISLSEQLSDDSSGKGLGIINENSEGYGSDYVIVSEEEREKLKRGTYIDLAPNLSKNKDRHFFETKIVYNGIKLPIRVPLTVNPEEVGDKRIIFLGQGHPSGDVANYVLSACAMGSGSGGVLGGFTERFIAGVTNRIFEDHSTWWDVLCNIDTGKIIVSKDIATPSYGTKPDEKPEEAIRGKFQEYVQRFVRLTALYEVETFGSTKIGMMPEDTYYPGILGTGLAFQDDNSKHRELAANINRIEGWRQTISYKYYQLDFQNYLKTRNIKSFDVHHQVSKLKMLKNMPEQEVETLYKAFVNSVSTDEQIIEFLSYLPQNQGGLFPIGLGLFYPLKTVRDNTIELFNRLNSHATGSKFIQSLNSFQKLAYERQLNQKRERQQQLEFANKLALILMKLNGLNIPVTDENKKEYIEYMDRISKHVENQFKVFMEGFNRLTPQVFDEPTKTVLTGFPVFGSNHLTK
ncbi:3141_t:CDS:10 [Cetraspora pellucida]|uniref:3141_t:CDS:1 n=1 Tax=Cetraspora pellucida TaxID=1433469 RepID=A0A9N9I9F8_9GLOM|nr:3141_t:CDS:10 [Cetraspora pellucida]